MSLLVKLLRATGSRLSTSVNARLTFPTLARMYSTGQEDVQAKVLEILKGYDALQSTEVGLSSHFVNDLGLDSLDAVELVMAVEDEFNVEIPDADAEKMLSGDAIVQYIVSKQSEQ